MAWRAHVARASPHSPAPASNPRSAHCLPRECPLQCDMPLAGVCNDAKRALATLPRPARHRLIQIIQVGAVEAEPVVKGALSIVLGAAQSPVRSARSWMDSSGLRPPRCLTAAMAAHTSISCIKFRATSSPPSRKNSGELPRLRERGGPVLLAVVGKSCDNERRFPTISRASPNRPARCGLHAGDTLPSPPATMCMHRR